jgi:D-glycero-alpha-D-manno-heptose-7-phosphate kinase
MKISTDIMVRSRAPLRISFAGGGTELPPFIEKYGGLVISSTISKYAHTTIKWLPGNDKIIFRALDLLKETEWEHKGYLDYLTKPVAGDLLLHQAVLQEFLGEYSLVLPVPIEISTFCDAPEGSGLGSSSTLTVSIVKALSLFFGIPLKDSEIAKLAYKVERKKLGFAGGLQDHYSATYGGLNYIDFKKSGEVIVNQLRLSESHRAEFESWLVMVYTGLARNSGEVIEKQITKINNSDQETIKKLLKIKEYAEHFKNLIMSENFKELGNLMHSAWFEKRSISDSISNEKIDDLYDTARKFGAIGGKLSGAGGGGYLMLLCDPDNKPKLFSELLSKTEYKAENIYLSKDSATAWRIQKSDNGE